MRKWIVMTSVLAFTLISCKTKDGDKGSPQAAVPTPPAAQDAPPSPGPDEADHVPCGSHGQGEATDPSKRFPSVFKTLPAHGTKISCPIKGETFEFDDRRPSTEYKGKIYVFGCNGCKGIFLKDPEVALKKYTFIEAP